MKQKSRSSLLWYLVIFGALLAGASGQTPSSTPSTPSTLGLEQGFAEFETADFKIKLVKASQTLAALEPKGAGGFDFAPADRLSLRARDGFYHLGDITFRLKNDD